MTLRVGLLAAAAAFGLLAQPGPIERQVVDKAAADRGRRVYSQFCINCHGNRAQGTDQGPDLVRSVTVLHDRLGSELAAALRKLPNHPGDIPAGQLADLSHFLKDRVEYTAQDRNASQEPNVLTGNADAGRAYFNGAGKCASCHSPTGDLAGIATKYPPVTLQQRILFPRAGRAIKPAQVTVRPPSGAAVSGNLERIDDFSVSLRDSSGEYRSWRRAPDLQVEVRDPYAAHNQMLDTYTDADIHNLVAFLETLK
jgi:cytochrome c oxidase cbb3-type subunit 3